jgi:Zn-dependent M28 family amino/carboxypeptidase
MRVDEARPPVMTADETFFEFALRNASMSFADLRRRADDNQEVPAFSLPGLAVTIDIATSYELTNVQYTQNVVGLVEGTDPALRDTYVFFGAHLDHEGYATGSQPQGRVNTPLEQDRIWNGADDDASGCAALLAMAKAFAQGPRPKRSVVFVWHAGEEPGLLGSSYMAEHPVVPLDRIQVQLNVDMIGRNRDNDSAQSNTVYVIGADRISTDLHNLIVDVNASQQRPLSLDYEYNDENDPNRFYVRSDHYSYAAKGIPIAFFFTGEHPDYHANTDTADKILFPKLVRIAQLIYETGYRVADAATELQRDNRGSRSGRGFAGRLE